MQNFSGGPVRASPCSSYLHAPLYEEFIALNRFRHLSALGGARTDRGPQPGDRTSMDDYLWNPSGPAE
jgi:hypothetical protein